MIGSKLEMFVNQEDIEKIERELLSYENFVDALLYACRSKKEKVVYYLLNKSKQNDISLLEDTSGIFIKKESIETLEFFLKYVEDIDKVNNYNYSMLMYACQFENKNIVTYLMDKGANIYDAMFFAIKYGNEKVLSYIVDNGYIGVNETDRYGNTPLVYACYFGNLNIIDYFINKGVNIYYLTFYIIGFAKESPYYKEHRAIVLINYLIHKGLDIRKLSIYAIRHNNQDVLDYIIDKNYIKINDISEYNFLMHACKFKDKDVIAYLMNKGESMYNALFCAIKYDKLDIVSFIIDNEYVGINQTDEYGYTPFMFACRFSNMNIINYLIENKVNVSVQDNSGKTALMYACINCSPCEVIEAILEKMSVDDINIQDNNGKTALMYAATTNFYNVKCLLKRQANIDMLDKEKKSAFVYAYEYEGNLGQDFSRPKKHIALYLLSCMKNKDSVLDYAFSEPSKNDVIEYFFYCYFDCLFEYVFIKNDFVSVAKHRFYQLYKIIYCRGSSKKFIEDREENKKQEILDIPEEKTDVITKGNIGMTW